MCRVGQYHTIPTSRLIVSIDCSTWLHFRSAYPAYSGVLGSLSKSLLKLLISVFCCALQMCGKFVFNVVVCEHLSIDLFLVFCLICTCCVFLFMIVFTITRSVNVTYWKVDICVHLNTVRHKNVPLYFLGRLLRVDLIKLISNVRPSTKSSFDFNEI